MFLSLSAKVKKNNLLCCVGQILFLFYVPAEYNSPLGDAA